MLFQTLGHTNLGERGWGRARLRANPLTTFGRGAGHRHRHLHDQHRLHHSGDGEAPVQLLSGLAEDVRLAFLLIEGLHHEAARPAGEGVWTPTAPPDPVPPSGLT